MSTQKHLIIMAKEPRIGRVKTRLASDIGTVKAWSFYRHTLARIVGTLARDTRWQTWLAVSPNRSVSSHRVWPAGVPRFDQGTGNLGARMERAMQTVGGRGPVVLIGADIPEITPNQIANAFSVLGHNDVVFGPAEDGGFWLVGQRRRPRFLELFTDVRWSHAETLNDTLRNIGQSADTGFITPLADVDDGESYQNYLNRKARIQGLPNFQC